MLLARLGLILGATLIAGAAAAKECRTRDGSQGVRDSLSGVCMAKPAAPGGVADGGLRQGREAGFIDLGNGTQVRIGGRVRADVVIRN